MLSWDAAKRHFHIDGSWRDIVVLDTSNADWTTMLRWVRDSGLPFSFTEDGDPAPFKAERFGT